MGSNRRLTRFRARVRAFRWRYTVLAGVCFWLPDLAHHCLMRSEGTLIAIGLLTVGMPLSVVIAWAAVRGRRQQSQSISLSMILGIWLFGPTTIMLGNTCLGTGFRSGSLLANLAWLTLFTVIPLYLLLMAGLDFSIIGLLLGTLALAVLHRKYERGRHLLPVDSHDAAVSERLKETDGGGHPGLHTAE